MNREQSKLVEHELKINPLQTLAQGGKTSRPKNIQLQKQFSDAKHTDCSYYLCSIKKEMNETYRTQVFNLSRPCRWQNQPPNPLFSSHASISRIKMIEWHITSLSGLSILSRGWGVSKLIQDDDFNRQQLAVALTYSRAHHCSFPRVPYLVLSSSQGNT